MRLDKFLVENNGYSRTKAQQMIKDNMVSINGKLASKPSIDIGDNDVVDILANFSFASLGGDKLQKALNDFEYTPKELVCVDIGASNGGFTDCMLQSGARKVYAVDVGECAFDDFLKNNPKVIVKDKTNARFLTWEDLGEKCDFCSVDVSFISLKLILPTVFNLLKEGGKCIALVKPQFEVGKKHLSKTGIVTDNKVRDMVLEEIKTFAKSLGFEILGTTTAPIKQKKNIEFLIFINKTIE